MGADPRYDITPQRLGAAICDLREEAGATLDELADTTAIPPRRLARIEAGLATATLSEVVAIARQLGLPIRELTNHAAQPPERRAPRTTTGPEPGTLSGNERGGRRGGQPPTDANWHHPLRQIARQQALLFGLTPREEDIAELILTGVTATPRIAEALGIREQTVKNILNSIYTKSGVVDRTQLALRLIGLF